MLNNKEKGFTLLELLISVFILTVGILGAYIAIQKSATIATYSYNRLTAAYLAQEGIEIMRNIKDTNLLEGLSNPSISWDEGILARNYQIQYSDSQTESPIFIICPGLCNFNDLGFLTRDDVDIFYDYFPSQNTKFKRKVSVEVGIDVINITATVYWQDGTKIREFKVWDKFYNWL